jgi:hypothetical protein
MPTPGQNDRHFLLDPVENAFAPSIDATRRGTCITISVSDAAVGDVIDCGFDRLVLERSLDGKLTWQEITKPDTRPVLERERTDYTVIDGNGDPSYWYRTKYIDTKTGECSEPSEPIEGLGLAIRNILTVSQLKARYFFGTDITDDAGRPLSDAVFQHYILAAIRWFEHEIDIPILPTLFQDSQDYYREDYHAFNFIQLDNYPLVSVERFRVQYPSGQTVIEFPREWMRVDAEAGHLRIVPTAGTLSEILVGQGGSFLPAIYNGMAHLPHLFQVEYVAGFGHGQVPRNIVDLIGMFAALGPFHLFGDLIAGAGIATISLSMDGLSQSIGTTSSATNAGYGARIGNYLKQVKQQIPALRRYYKGVRMVVA